MNITEITQDLDTTDTASHREAFRVLVEYPDQDTIEGASADELETALLSACELLIQDEGGHLLPGQLRQSLPMLWT